MVPLKELPKLSYQIIKQLIEMFKLKYFTFLILVFFFNFISPRSSYSTIEKLQIRIFAHLKINSFQWSAISKSYKLIADNSPLEFNVSNFNLFIKGDSIEIKEKDFVLGTFKQINFIGDSNDEFKIKLTQPDRKIRTYQNNLTCSVVNGSIVLINNIDLDNYVAGVTEAEAGSKSNLEFYKVQTILARTFALAHINKHQEEGFYLCDQVHCQAYHGKPRDSKIILAIQETKEKVVVDDNLNLIIAAFHSNSGGQTANSEDVWGSKTSYLKSIVDTFSIQMPNYNWERKMLTEDWLSYLKLKFNYPSDSIMARDVAINFTQDNRKVYLEFNNLKVPLKTIRLDLQLKSTFFNITKLNNDSILFKGKGFGHGVGMPQEGAMKMGKLGYSYLDILDFYFKNIQIIDLQKLDFFKDE